jgi:hypothetical protein
MYLLVYRKYIEVMVLFLAADVLNKHIARNIDTHYTCITIYLIRLKAVSTIGTSYPVGNITVDLQSKPVVATFPAAVGFLIVVVHCHSSFI